MALFNEKYTIILADDDEDYIEALKDDILLEIKTVDVSASVNIILVTCFSEFEYLVRSSKETRDMYDLAVVDVLLRRYRSDAVNSDSCGHEAQDLLEKNSPDTKLILISIDETIVAHYDHVLDKSENIEKIILDLYLNQVS